MASRLTDRLAAIACVVQLSTLLAQQSTAQPASPAAVASPSRSAAEWVLPDSLTLPAALDLARKVHPELRVADAELAVARADSLFARVLAFSPEVQLQISRGGPSLGSSSEGTLDLGVSQELELWGKRNARQSVATARSRTSAAEWAAKLQEIESDVRARFEHTVFLQDRMATLDELADLDPSRTRA